MTHFDNAGGMGTVYKVKDRLTGDIVALKQVLLSGDAHEVVTGKGAREHHLALVVAFPSSYEMEDTIT